MSLGDLSITRTTRPHPDEEFARSSDREREKTDGLVPVASGAADDGTLLERMAAGDEAAMASLYDRYGKLVFSIALRVMRDPAAAEDVVQELLMQIWRKPEYFMARKNALGAWLSVAARNRSIDVLRRRKPTEDVTEMSIDSGYNLANEAERLILANRARGIMSQLPTEQRKALELAFFDGLTHTEIAQMTGDPLGTVKGRIRSALLTLRRGMQS